MRHIIKVRFDLNCKKSNKKEKWGCQRTCRCCHSLYITEYLSALRWSRAWRMAVGLVLVYWHDSVESAILWTPGTLGSWCFSTLAHRLHKAPARALLSCKQINVETRNVAPRPLRRVALYYCCCCCAYTYMRAEPPGRFHDQPLACISCRGMWERGEGEGGRTGKASCHGYFSSLSRSLLAWTDPSRHQQQPDDEAKRRASSRQTNCMLKFERSELGELEGMSLLNGLCRQLINALSAASTLDSLAHHVPKVLKRASFCYLSA